MSTHTIAVVPGDGIGPEVVAQGLKVLKAAGRRFDITFDFTEFDWGSSYYFKHGRMMPAEGLEAIRPFDAIYFGAVGHPDVPDDVTLQGLLLPIRRAFDQYVCLRPNFLYRGVRSALRGKKAGSIDLVVVRENTEGEYSPVGGMVYQGTPQEVAIQTAVFTRRGTERIIRYAFELAEKRDGKRKVTSATKSNALGYSMVFWDRVFQEVAEEFPGIEADSLLVDACCMNLIRRPEAFDVIVASNLFGDILSDIAAQVTGSMGLAPSGNINPERRFPSSFEPVHGSAPDIAGKQIANPIGAILSSAMMLEHLGEAEAAAEVRMAVETTLARSRLYTPDLGGSASTSRVGDEVVRLVGSPRSE